MQNENQGPLNFCEYFVIPSAGTGGSRNMAAPVTPYRSKTESRFPATPGTPGSVSGLTGALMPNTDLSTDSINRYH